MNAADRAWQLLADWDFSATPDHFGCHNAGGFALDNAQEIRETLRGLLKAQDAA